MKEIYLIRHGKPVYPLDAKGRRLAYGPEVPLSKEGEKDIMEMLVKLPRFDVLYVSPFQRTQDTARIIARTQGLKKEQLITRITLRDFVPKNVIGKPIMDIVSGKLVIPPHKDDEHPKEAFQRIIGEFESILNERRTGVVGLVFHGDPIRWIIWQHIEGNTDLPQKQHTDILHNRYYLNPAEAFHMTVDTKGNIVGHEIIHHPANPTPGVRRL